MIEIMQQNASDMKKAYRQLFIHIVADSER